MFFSTANLHAVLVASAILIVVAVGQTFVIVTAGIDLSMAATITLGAIVLGIYPAGGRQSFAAWVQSWWRVARVPERPRDHRRQDSRLRGDARLALGCHRPRADPVRRRADHGFEPVSPQAPSSGRPVRLPRPGRRRRGAGSAHRSFSYPFRRPPAGDRRPPESARSLGIHTDRVSIAAYTISGLCAGIAAILLVARIGSAEPTVNTNLLLNSVAAVVLGGVSLFGGRGSILGPVFGALMLTTLVNGLTLLGVSAFYQPLAVGIIVVLAALIMRYQR